MPQAAANGIQLEYETFGKPADPAILLIMGLGGQLLLWPDEFCSQLAQGGYHVIRYDNRDVGLSTRLHDAGKPRLIRAGLFSALRLPVRAPYTLDDMAADATGLLDALGIGRAHVVGMSMGGMIGQIICARMPQRVLSFTCIMSTSGNPRLPQPALRLRLRLVRRPKKLDREASIRHSVRTWEMIGSPGYPVPPDLLLDQMTRSYDRSAYPRGVARQTLAVIAGGSRLRLLRRIKAPTLIIHGAQDPLVPVAAAHELARRIRDSRLEIIEGMGHNLPPQLLPRLSELILGHVAG